MSELDLVDPVDILSQLPNSFKTNLESKKWQERKDALDKLLELLVKNPKLDPQVQYGEIVKQLKIIIEKDSNINVGALGTSCLKGIASGLSTKFAPHVPTVIPVILERFKEKKPTLRTPLNECVDAILATTTLDEMVDQIVVAMGKPNPQIKAQTSLFLSRAFKRYSSTTMPKKSLKAIAPLLVKHTTDSDPEVREAAYEALGSAMRATGETPIMPLLSDIAEDKMKMGKIKEHYQNFLNEIGPGGLESQQAAQADITEANVSASAPQDADVASVNEADPFDLLDPVDVLSKLPAEFRTNAESKKWTERRDALQALIDLLEKHPKLDSDVQYGETVALLKKVLEKDTNINVCALAAKCLKGIAAGLRTKFAPHALPVVPVIFEKFKEKKSNLRDPLIECIDAVYASITLEQMQEDIVSAMEKANPNIKMQTDLFLHRAFLKFNSTTMPKRALKALASLLVKHTGDSDPEVRDASYTALAAAMRAMGEKPILSILGDVAEDKTKKSKIEEAYKKIINEHGPPPVTPAGFKVEYETDNPPPKASQKAAPKPATRQSVARAKTLQSINGNEKKAEKPVVQYVPPKRAPIPVPAAKKADILTTNNVKPKEESSVKTGNAPRPAARVGTAVDVRTRRTSTAPGPSMPSVASTPMSSTVTVRVPPRVGQLSTEKKVTGRASLAPTPSSVRITREAGPPEPMRVATAPPPPRPTSSRVYTGPTGIPLPKSTSRPRPPSH